MKLEVDRFFYGKTCTLGVMRWGAEIIYTCEDSWLDNKPILSCIPDGLYLCKPRQFFRGKYPAVEITGVPGRSTILIHRGNKAADVSGCIVVGAELAVFGGNLGVANSARAWSIFFPAWGGREFELEIRPIPPLAGTKETT